MGILEPMKYDTYTIEHRKLGTENGRVEMTRVLDDYAILGWSIHSTVNLWKEGQLIFLLQREGGVTL